MQDILLYIAASLPVLTMIALLPLVLYRLFPPGLTNTPDAPKAARDALRTMGSLTRDEWIVAVAFALMVTGWVMAGTLNLSLAAVAFAGLGALLATKVLTLDDINLQGGTLVTFIWLAVLFALSGQLNELGFMGYVGGRLTSLLGGMTWPNAYVVLLVLYVLMHYLFVSQTAQILALFDVFLGVGVKTGVSVWPATPRLRTKSTRHASGVGGDVIDADRGRARRHLRSAPPSARRCAAARCTWRRCSTCAATRS